jgi:hypothetical protein
MRTPKMILVLCVAAAAAIAAVPTALAEETKC